MIPQAMAQPGRTRAPTRTIEMRKSRTSATLRMSKVSRASGTMRSSAARHRSSARAPLSIYGGPDDAAREPAGGGSGADGGVMQLGALRKIQEQLDVLESDFAMRFNARRFGATFLMWMALPVAIVLPQLSR